MFSSKRSRQQQIGRQSARTKKAAALRAELPSRIGIEQLEERLLMSVVGGETFTFTNARGITTTVTLQGDIIATLIGSIIDDRGNLLFAEMGGSITASSIGRGGSFIGDGCEPVSFDESTGALTNITDNIGPSGSFTWPGQQGSINIQALTSDELGTTYAFNVFTLGNVDQSDPAAPENRIQFLTLNNSTGAANVEFRLENDLSNWNVTATILVDDDNDPQTPDVPQLTNVGTTTSIVAIPAAAFNPVDGLVYFVGRGQQIAQSIAAPNQFDLVDALYAIDPNTGTISPGQALNNINNFGTFGDNAAGTSVSVTAIAWDQDGVGSADLWAYRVNNGVGQIIRVDPTDTDNVIEVHDVNFSNGANINNITGLAFVDEDPTTGETFVFGTRDAGGASELIRIRLENGGATNFGNTRDLEDVGAGGNIVLGAPFRGDDLQDLTWNPLFLNPFTGEEGALLATDATSDELVVIDHRFRITDNADVFAVYVSRSDENASISFAGPTLYTGSIGNFAPIGSTAGLNTGQLYLGALGQSPTNANVFDRPEIFGDQSDAIGTRPGLIDDLLDQGESISAGLTVGSTLQQVIDADSDLVDQLMGNNIDIVEGLTVARDGTVFAIDVDGAGIAGDAINGGGDQLVEIDGQTGEADLPIDIEFNGDNLRNVQGLDFGDVDFDGFEDLFAIYDLRELGLGGGPELGIIDTDTGEFASLNANGIGLTNDAQVLAMAFSPGSGSTPGQQGLYVIYDEDVTDIDNPLLLQELDPLTGQLVGAPVQVLINGADIIVGSMDFDGQGRLIVQDLGHGRLLDVNLATGEAGENVVTADGTVNATVGAISFDPLQERFIVADNVTGSLRMTEALEGAAEESAILMVLADFGVVTPADIAQHIGGFLFDGIATGQVNVSGSADLLYFGWALFGESRAFNTGAAQTQGQVTGAPERPGNVTIGGDLRNFVSLASAGTDAIIDRGNARAFSPRYYTGLDIAVGGRVGQIRSLGSFAGNVTVADGSIAPILTEGALLQQEVESYAGSFGQGDLLGPVANVATRFLFSNSTFDTAQYLGTIRSATSGQPDLVHLEGSLERFRNNGVLIDPVDYYALSLQAGQTITVQVFTPDPFATPPQFGIFDPDGRLIATDYSNVDPASVLNQPIRFTADRPGTYRIAITTPTDADFNGDAGEFTGISGSTIDYELIIEDGGTVTLGGLVANGGVYSDSGDAFDPVPSIQVLNGDIGAIVADADLDASAATGFHLIFTGGDGANIQVSNGNVRHLQGGSVGYFFPGDALTLPSFGAEVGVSVPNGGVGLIRNTAENQVLAASFSTPAGRDIQMLDATNELGGFYATRQGMGVIRAQDMTMGTAVTEFRVNSDGIGSDGIIDLIDVRDDFGSVNGGGPAIFTNTGGNVRFIRVLGDIFQDLLFGGGTTETPLGAITHSAGVTVTLRDDSGAILTLTPGAIPNPAAGTPGATPTIAGRLITRTYGIRGSGGVVLIEAQSNGSLTVSAASGFAGRPAEVTRITSTGTGNAVTLSPLGVPTAPVAPAANSPTVDILIRSSTSNARVDVLDIIAPNTNFGTISNSTLGGQMINLNVGTVVELVSNGSIGLNPGTGGVAVNPSQVLPNQFPFVQQRTAVRTGNIVTVRATEGIGNLIVAGSISTITPDSDSKDVTTAFEGINAPIFASGQIFTVNIGEGVLPSGSGEMAHSGIFANGRITTVTGKGEGRDIRGDIVSQDSIGEIKLTDGAIINADIMVANAPNDSREFDALPTASDNVADTIENPVFEIGLIELRGKGGIIGTQVFAADIGDTTITGGFGLFNSVYFGIGDTVMGDVTVSGYGIRGTNFNGGAALGDITLTANGAPVLSNTFSSSVRQGIANEFDPFFGIQPNRLTDLNEYLDTSPAGTITGVIEDVLADGSRNLGLVKAFQILNTEFNFANSTLGIITKDIINNLSVVTGELPTFTAGNDVTDLNLEVAGKIGKFTVTGDVLEDFFGTFITAKGPNGDLGTFVVTGSFNGDLVVAGQATTITIGTAQDPDSGNVNGDITISGEGVPEDKLTLTTMTLFGALADGSLDIDGNVGTITAHRDLGQLGDTMTIGGNLKTLKVGAASAVNGSTMGLDLIVEGDVDSVTINGKMEGDLTVKGNLKSLSVLADAVTGGVGLSILSGDVKVQDTLTTLIVTGNDVSGAIIAGRKVGSVTINNGDLTETGEIVSTLGDITTVSIKNGDMLGRIAAVNGRVNAVTVTGSDMGANAIIEARSAGTINFAGSMLAGAVIDIVNEATTIQFGVDIAAGASISAGAAGTIKTTRDMLGDLDLGFRPGGTTIAAGRDFAGTSTIDSNTTVTVGRDFGTLGVQASLAVGEDLTSLAVKGVWRGDVLADGFIKSATAASMDGAVITAGFDITNLAVIGAVTNSLVQAGLQRGDDGEFGTGDLFEQPRMGVITTLKVGSLTDSVIAAGGNIVNFTSTGAQTNSSVSAGLVLDGDAIQTVIDDATPLADATEQNAARSGATLFHGSVTAAKVGTVVTGLVNSDVTAGVSPGADGQFGTGDDNVTSSRTGGRSQVAKFTGAVDVNSNLLGDRIPAGTAVEYLISDITVNNPLIGAPTATATSVATQIITDGANSITVTVTGPGSVQIFDDASTDDRVDTLIITGGTAATIVTVTSTNPNGYGIGRVLMTDDALLGTLTTNTDLLGDGTEDVDLWLEGDIKLVQFRNMPNDADWSGQIGGNVTTLTMARQGPGRLQVGGAITTLNIATSIGDPALVLLGTGTTPPLTGSPTDMATDSAGNTIVFDGINLVPVNVNTGVPGVAVPVIGLGQGLRTITFASADVPLAINDFVTGESILNIAGQPGAITDVNVRLNITHTFDGDMDVFLTSPNGTVVELFSDVGDTGENFTNTVIDDEGGTAITAGSAPFTGTFRPEGLLADFDGESANGTWTLSIFDDAGSDAGQLLNWSLEITLDDTSALGAIPAIDYDANDVLYGVSTIFHQAPTVLVGEISPAADLHGFAVSSTGRLFAIDSSSGDDELVEINAATGDITVIGTLQDTFGNTYTNNVRSLVFRGTGISEILLAVLDDRDGDSGVFSEANGAALAKIEFVDSNQDGILRVSNPTSSGGALPPVFIDGDGTAGNPITAVTDDFTALAVRRSDNAIFAIRRVAGTDVLVRVTIGGNGGTATTIITTLGTVKVNSGADDTDIIGMGFNAAHELVAYTNDGTDANLVTVDTTDPGLSSLQLAAAALDPDVDAFAIGFNTSNFSTFSYNTDAGGSLFTNPGLVPTLGVLNTTTGSFTPFVGMAIDADGTPLDAGVLSITIDKLGSGDVFVATDDGRLIRYNADGTLDSVVGSFVDAATGSPVDIRSIQFDGEGDLIGLDGALNRIVEIDPNTGEALAVGVSETGLVDVSDLAGIDFDPISQRILSYSNSADQFVEGLFDSSDSIGGITANSVANLNITGADYNGRVQATGNTFGAIKVTGGGDFSGSIVTAGSINSYTQTGGGNFAGILAAGRDIGSFTLTGGNVTSDGFLSAGNTAGKIAVNATGVNGGGFSGALISRALTSFTVAKDVGASGSLDIDLTAGAITINGQMNGQMNFGSLTGSFKAVGIFGGSVTVENDATTTNLTGGTAVGSTYIVQGAILGSTVIGATHSGLVAGHYGATSVSLATVQGGIVVIGMDTSTLTVSGDVTDGLFSFGTWLGEDGQYNSIDDLITGGSIKNATFKKTFTDSVIAAGVLPRQGVDVQANTLGLPADRRAFIGNPTAADIADIDSVEAGGLLPSIITKLTITGVVTNTSLATGLQSIAVAADELGEITAGAPLTRRTLNDPLGNPTIEEITRINDTQLRVLFSELMNSAAFSISVDGNGDGDLDDAGDTVGSVTVRDTNGDVINGITLAYTTQAGLLNDQGVLSILRAAGFGNEAINIDLSGAAAAPTLFDRSGLRSALRDFNQDGTAELGEDIFGTILDSDGDGAEGGVSVGLIFPADVGDNFDDATVGVLPLVVGTPLTIGGTSFESNGDVDIFSFNGLAGQFFAVDYNGATPAQMAVFFRDDQGTIGDLTDDTFELLSRYEDNVDATFYGNDALFQAFELPENGEYFVAVTTFDNTSVGGTYTLTAALDNTDDDLLDTIGASLIGGGRIELLNGDVDQIAYVNNIDNPAKQLVFLNVTGGVSDGFVTSDGVLVPFSALDASTLDSQLAGLTASLINGDVDLGVTGLVDVILNVFSDALGGDVHRITSGADLTAFNAATTGLWITTDPALVAGFDADADYTTLFVGDADDTLLGGGLFGISNNVDVANLDKADQVLVFANVFAGLSPSNFVPQLLNDYALALGNVAAHELGHAFGLSHVDQLTDDDAANSVSGNFAVMASGLAGDTEDLFEIQVLGTSLIFFQEFTIGSQDDFDLIGRWLS